MKYRQNPDLNRHRRAVKSFAGIMCAILALAFASCDPVVESGSPAPLIAILVQPQAFTTVTEGSISGTLSVFATATEGAELSYQWYEMADPAPLKRAAGPNCTIPVDLPVGTYYFFCEITAVSSGGKQVLISDTAEVTVKTKPPVTQAPLITITAQPVQTTTVTQGSIAGTLSVTASVTEGAALSYQWYEGDTPASNVSTSGSFIIPTGLTAGTYSYYCEVTAEGAAPVKSNIATVTVNVPDIPSVPLITIIIQPAQTTTVTQGSIAGTLSVTANVTKGAALSYQWYQNTENNSDGGVMVSSQSSNASFTIPEDLTVGAYYYYCEITAEGAAPVKSNTATVTVNAPDSVITITEQPAPLTTVTQGSIAGSLNMAVSLWEWEDEITYRWYQNTENNTSGGTQVWSVYGNVTNCSFPIPASLIPGTYYYYCVVTAEDAASVTSNIAQITVNAPDTPLVVTITTQPEPTTTVTRGSISGSLNIAVSLWDAWEGTIEYKWYYNTVNNTSGGIPVRSTYTSVTSCSFPIPTNLLAGTYYYYCVVTAEGAAPVTSNVATVTVKAPAPVISIVTQPAPLTTVTVGIITGNLSVAANVTGNLPRYYEWYSNTTDSNEGGTLVQSASTNGSFTIPNTLTTGTYYYYCVVTASGAVAVTSNVATVVVDPPVIYILTQPAQTTSITAGYEDNVSIFAFSQGSSVLHYQWYVNTTDSNEGGIEAGNDSTSGISSFTISNTLAIGTYYYYCVVTAEGAAAVRSNVATVEVIPPAYVMTIGTQPAAITTVREGNISEYLRVWINSDGALPHYEWYSNTTNSTEGGTLLVSNNSASRFAIPKTLTTGTYYYYCVIREAFEEATPVTSNVATVIVEPAIPPPVISITTQPEPNISVIQFSDITETVSVIATATENAVPNYQWFKSGTNNAAGGSAVSEISTDGSFAIPTSLSNNGTMYFYCVVTAAGAEPVYSNIVTVTVIDPVITITSQPAPATTVTVGSIDTRLDVSASVTGNIAATYTWYRSETNSNSGGTEVRYAATGFYYVPNDLATGTYYYYCKVTALGALPIYSDVAVVTVVPPVPLISITSQPAAATNVTEGRITGSLSVGASVTENAVLSYQWYSNSVNNNSGGALIGGAAESIFTIPANLTMGTYYYYCVLSAPDGAIAVASETAAVTVTKAAPELTFVITLADMSDPNFVPQTATSTANTDKVFTASGTGYTWQWYLDGTATGVSSGSYTFNRPAGVYELVVVATNASGQKYSGRCRITVQ